MRKPLLLAALLISFVAVGAAPATPVQPPGPPGGGTISVPSGIVVRGTLAPDMGQMPPPADYPYLMQHARHGTGPLLDPDEYRRRWEALRLETEQCDGNTFGWFLHVAHFTDRPEIRAHTAAVIEEIALRDPQCLLRGLEHPLVLHLADRLIDRFLIEPSHTSFARLDAALAPALDAAQAPQAAARYRERLAQRERQRAEQEQRRMREATEARRRYWLALQDRSFLQSSPEEYWQRWHALAAAAATCDDLELVTYFLAAANRLRDVAQAYLLNASAIEALALSDGACIIRGMEKLPGAGAFIERYLIETPNVEALYAAMAMLPAEESAAWRAYERAYRSYRYRVASPVTAKERFLWATKAFTTDPHGRILVPATYVKGHLDFQPRLRELWEGTADAGLRDHWNRPLRVLPLAALDFMTLHQFGTYFLLWIAPEGVEAVKARAVASALGYSACDEVLSLLVLEPERRPAWLTGAGRYPEYGVALELRDDLPPPELAHLGRSDDHLLHGSLSWPTAARGFEFSYSGASSGFDFHLRDSSSGEEHWLRDDFSCH